ncbi:MAG: helix-turn-helix domain-containing protein [Actinomycetota bacterium]
MRHPVYAFRAVVRELRQDAGLSILAAAETTGYGNYGRWESGRTRIGAQHLRSLAEGVRVTDDLYLLLFAWLADRLSPPPGDPANSMGLDKVRRRLRAAPDTVVDLREHKDLVVEPGRHVDLAFLGLAARYAGHGMIVLPGVGRTRYHPRELTNRSSPASTATSSTTALSR